MYTYISWLHSHKLKESGWKGKGELGKEGVKSAVLDAEGYGEAGYQASC